jgi:alpha-mannosidase
MQNATVAYEVPFGTVKVGQDEIITAGDRYTPLCKDVHPRAILDWISVSDNEMSVTLSSSVAAADWIDPTSQNENIVLQHLLLASRTSVHWEGNRYSQEGNHYYNNILTSNKTGDIAGMRIAKQQNDPLQVKIYPNKSNDVTLPESASFFNIDKENVIITTIKKAEDTDNLIIRMSDAEGKNARVNLNSFFNIDKVQQTNIIEENPQPVQELNISKYAIETFSFEAKK